MSAAGHQPFSPLRLTSCGGLCIWVRHFSLAGEIKKAPPGITPGGVWKIPKCSTDVELFPFSLAILEEKDSLQWKPRRPQAAGNDKADENLWWFQINILPAAAHLFWSFWWWIFGVVGLVVWWGGGVRHARNSCGVIYFTVCKLYTYETCHSVP